MLRLVDDIDLGEICLKLNSKLQFQDCKKCAPLVKKDCEICMKKFPKEDSSECVKKALAKEGKKECMECAKCEKPKMPFAPVQVGVISKTIDQKIKL